MIVDERHALYVGWVIGLAIRSRLEPVPVVDGDGNYTDEIGLPMIGAVTVTIVVPYPPVDWSLTDTPVDWSPADTP